MAYVSLYRKYRPQTFAEVVGQGHVTTTLVHAVADDRLHHAYLFTGPRGTGKTSTARILAKSLNCEQGPTPTPCNVCSQCLAITEGSSVDVIEIDAASHGGVDDIRELRDRVAFAPASARMKVYIVDECHMLSTAGWNAFLKTVEEPPGHVVFVFATTEPHKVLETILSRTQRFDFKRVDAAALAGHVRDLGDREGLSLSDGAVGAIVQAGDGSVRDTLSVLEQVVAFGGAEITEAAVAEVLGAVPEQLLIEAAQLMADGDAAGLCVLVGRLADSGHDLRQFARDAVEHLRALFLLQTAPDAGLVEGAPERLARLQEQAARLGQVTLLRAIELLAEAQAQMRRGNTRLPLEIALVKAALPEASGDRGALAARFERLERAVASAPPRAASQSPAELSQSSAEARQPAAAVAAQPSPAEASQASPAAATQPSPAELRPAPPQASDVSPETAADEQPAVEIDLDDPDPDPDPDAGSGPASSGGVDLEAVTAAWPAVLEATKSRKRTLHAFLTEGQPVALDGDRLTLEFRSGYDFHAENCAREESRELLAGVLADVVGAPLRISTTVAPAAAAGASPSPSAAEDIDSQELTEVLEREAEEAAGEVPDDQQAHALAIETLTRDLGATVVDDPDRD